MLTRLKQNLKILIKPYGKTAFLNGERRNVKLLDVGSGNNSQENIMRSRFGVDYTGVDINDAKNTYRNTEKIIFCDAKNFSQTLSALDGDYDMVLSSHNIEHCYDPRGVVKAIAELTKDDGCIFFAFPSQKSKKFPSRKGTLNYYDDPTHVNHTITFEELILILETCECEIVFAKDGYRPFLLYLLGMLLEPISATTKRVLPGTWAFWGFECIVWAKKK